MPRYESPYDPRPMPKNLEHVHLREEGARRLRHDQPAGGAQRAALVCVRRAALLLARHRRSIPTSTSASSPAPAKRSARAATSSSSRSTRPKGKRTPHEDPNSPIFHWGGGGQPQRRQPREAADRRASTASRSASALARAAVPAARDGGRRVDRRHAHQGRPARLAARTCTPRCRARPPRT